MKTRSATQHGPTWNAHDPPCCTRERIERSHPMNAPRFSRRSVMLLLWLAAPLNAAPAPMNYDEAKVGNLPLPDPLLCVDGTPVRDPATWRVKRRPELLQLFATEVYGRTPAGRPP